MKIKMSEAVDVIEINYEPHVNSKIEHDLNYVENALNLIKSGKNGSKLINEIIRLSNSDKKIKINVSQHHAKTFARPKLTNLQEKFESNVINNSGIENESESSKIKSALLYAKSEGSSVEIYWNPNKEIHVTPDGEPHIVNNSRLAFISLTNQLVHGYKMLEGSYKGGVQTALAEKSPDDTLAEKKALGIGILNLKFLDKDISENGVRKDHGLERRDKII